jgi:Ferritin-like
MIKIDRSIVAGVRSAAKPGDLHKYLQSAIKLEHSTIPPYLTAMFSLKPGANDAIGRLIRSIVIEEMLHLSIVSNILIAIGGHPAINTADFVPRYPSPLPMSIGGSSFTVGIAAFSLPLVEKVFMTIEEPEHPIPIEKLEALAAAEQTYSTIGEFYAAVKQKLAELGDAIFTVRPERQMLTWFPSDEIFPIVDVASASAGIDIIVDQGEGTSTEPFERPGDPAHYYKFGEILNGREIVKTPTGYAYGGKPVPFDPAGVYPIKSDCKIADFPSESLVGERIRQFAYSYSSLLNTLHSAFNGEPGKIDVALGLMYELRVTSERLMTTPLPGSKTATVGPSFEYVTTSAPETPRQLHMSGS